jgi:hypothetical protein
MRGAGGASGSALLGFDFPLGVPHAYAERAGIGAWCDFLATLDGDAGREFFAVATRREEISLRRPFYPQRPGGTRPGAPAGGARRGDARRPAAPLRTRRRVTPRRRATVLDAGRTAGRQGGDQWLARRDRTGATRSRECNRPVAIRRPARRPAASGSAGAGGDLSGRVLPPPRRDVRGTAGAAQRQAGVRRAARQRRVAARLGGGDRCRVERRAARRARRRVRRAGGRRGSLRRRRRPVRHAQRRARATPVRRTAPDVCTRRIEGWILGQLPRD